MVSCVLQGGLGNQMFQTAMAIAYGLKHGVDVIIPTVIENPHYEGHQVYRFPGVNYSDEDLMLKYASGLVIYKEPSFEFTELPPMDNVCFEGYWQSYKYFDDYREQILKALNFKWKMKKNYCSVHIRLGDFLDKPDCHPPITKGYIFEAMMNIMTRVKDWEAIKFLVFSDSMRMAKEMLCSSEFKSFPIEYSEKRNEIEDLELASSCANNIGSNSAYSFWINYLNQNPNKISVFPVAWFGPSLPHNTKDLYPENALIL